MPENIVLNMDCMEYMKDIPEKHFELAIIDPEFGIKSPKHDKARYNKYILKKWNDKKSDKNYFKELFRISKNQIIWGGNYYTEILKSTKSWLIWNKLISGNPNGFSKFEMAWTSLNIPTEIININIQSIRNKIHDCQKPIALYRWLLENYAKKGDKIFDSHVGSGSSRIACYELGFDFIGTELDKDYWQAQEERFKLEKAKIDNEFYLPETQNNLFAGIK